MSETYLQVPLSPPTPLFQTGLEFPAAAPRHVSAAFLKQFSAHLCGKTQNTFLMEADHSRVNLLRADRARQQNGVVFLVNFQNKTPWAAWGLAQQSRRHNDLTT